MNCFQILGYPAWWVEKNKVAGGNGGSTSGGRSGLGGGKNSGNNTNRGHLQKTSSNPSAHLAWALAETQQVEEDRVAGAIAGGVAMIAAGVPNLSAE